MRLIQKSLFTQPLLPEALMMAVGVILYVFQLGQESLWIDEILSIGSAQGRLDLNRPLYFILLRVWLLVSQNETWLRTLSVIFGLGCIGLTYYLGRLLFARRVGLIAGLLFALSPLAINHTQEVRFYIMSAFLGLAGSLCLSYALHQPKAIALLGWITFRCLGFLTAQPNALLMVPDFVLIAWLLLKSPRDKSSFQLGRWRWALGILLIPTVIILKDVVPPLVEFLLNQKWYAGDVRSPTLSNLVGLLAALTAWPLAGPDGSETFYQPFFKLYAGLILVGAFFPLFNSKLRNSKLIWIALWGLFPVALVFLLSQFFPFLWLERYAVISIPYIVILLAVGWVWLWDRQQQIALFVAMLYLVAVSGPLLRYYTNDYHADWRGLAQEIQLYEQPGDRIVVYPGSFLPYINYYYDGSSTFVPIEDVDSYQDVDVETLVAKVESLGFLSDRVWLVCPIKDQWNGVKNEVIETLETRGFVLEQAAQMINHWDWGPTLYLFSAPTELSA